MKKHFLLPLLALMATLFATGCASLPSPPLATNVTVTFQEPDKFTDARSTFGGASDQNYLDILSTHLRRQAGRYVKADQQLDVTITDVDLAGDFIPTRTGLDDVRIVKDIYRPRITLEFKLTGPGGAVIKEGKRTLVDSFFMNNVGIIGRDEPLFYDKTLLDNWTRDEFKP